MSKWKYTEIESHLYEVTLDSWNQFPDFIGTEFLDYRNYVYRGHRKFSWKLESTFSRDFRSSKLKSDIEKAAAKHLDKFKLSTRGRRGSNPQILKDDNEWWALGQHYGLSTPLLDWSASPYVAAYFAFFGSEHDDEEFRSVVIVSKSIGMDNKKIVESHKGSGRPPIVEFVTPHLDENGRLVSQGGLFSRGPLDMDLESWVSKQTLDAANYQMVKVKIPNGDRHLVLRTLNRMNINHLSLFPDLEGASRYCNMELGIPKY